MNIVFSKNDHKYSAGDIIYTSVSKVIGKFKNEFRKDHWATYKALEELIPDFKTIKKGWNIESDEFIIFASNLVNQDDLTRTVKEITDKWENENTKSIEKGNFYHEQFENNSYKKGYELNPFDKKDYPIIFEKQDKDEKTCLVSNLFDLKDGYYPEILIWNEEHKIAGQSDKVFIETIGDKRFIDVDDLKGLDINTPIPTPNGWKKLIELNSGDQIFDGNGAITNIKNISDIHYNPCYKIKFDTNDEIIADHEHKWVVDVQYKKQHNYKVKYVSKEVEMTTEEMYNEIKSGKNLRIKCSKIQGNNKDLPIDPYLLGIWLADGNSHCGSITCINLDIWNEIIKRGYKLSHNYNIKSGKADSKCVYGLYKQLRKLNLLKNKHIPYQYLISSYEQRLDLLRGYMDGDGTLNRKRKRCSMQTTSLRQATDVSSLVSSLGFKPTIIPYSASGFGKKNIKAYSVNFTSLENPFLCRNKDYFEVIGSNLGKYSKYRTISEIDKTETIPTKCLEVDSEDHTYLFGLNFIKTHNTNKKISKSGFKGQKMKSPLNHIPDSNYYHYNLQISMYAWMLSQFGFEVRNLSFHHFNSPYILPYLKDEVELMIKSLNNGK